MFQILVFVLSFCSVSAGYYKVNINWDCVTTNENGQCTNWHQHGDIDEKCFPGDSLILTANSTIRMKDLALGDHVLSMVDGQIVEVPVFVWLHRIVNVPIEYTVLETTNGTITSSTMHSIGYYDQVTDTVSYKYTGDFVVGDVLVSPDNVHHNIINIARKMKTGLYAPYTDTGNFFVGDGTNYFLAHSFANVQNPDAMVLVFNMVLSMAGWFRPDVNQISNNSVSYIHPVGFYLKNYFGDMVMDQVPIDNKNSFMEAQKVTQRTRRTSSSTYNNDDDDDDGGTVSLIFVAIGGLGPVVMPPVNFTNFTNFNATNTTV